MRRVPVGLVEPDAVLTFDEVRLRDATLGILEQSVVRLGGDGPLVDRPLDGTACQAGRRVGDEPTIANHGKPRAEHRHVLDDMGGQHHDPILGQLGEQPVESQALLGIEPGRRLVDDDQPRIAGDGLGDPQPLAHPSRIGLDLAPRCEGEVNPFE